MQVVLTSIVKLKVRLVAHTSLLYRFAAVIELVTGASLLVLPTLAMQLLFRSPPSAAGEQLTQLYGLALIGLGVACWGNPCPAAAKRGLLIYNCTASILLFALAVRDLSGGVAVWLGTGIHLTLSVLMIRDQLRKISD